MTLLLLDTKAILYGLELIVPRTMFLSEMLFTTNQALSPVIASLVLLTSIASVSYISHSKVAKKIFGLLSFFFVGVILTNPLHNLAFTLTNVNTLYKFEYVPNILCNLSNIYIGLCILASFIIFSIGSFTNKNKASKILSFLGGVLAFLCYIICNLNLDVSFDIESITCLVASILLYAFVLHTNDYNYIPIIKDKTFELLNDGIIVVNSDFVIKDYNKALEKLFPDINFKNATGKKVGDIFRFYPVVIYALKNAKRENISIEGKNYSIEIYTSVENKKRNVIHTITFKQSKSFSILEQDQNATLDPLTQLKNKENFINMISFEYDNAVRYSLPFILMYLDIDNFSKLNEEYGRIAGDLLLSNVATLIKKEIRKTDILARIQDDRFALLLTHTNLKNSESVAERIRKRIEKNSMAYEDKLINATISIGITGSSEVTNTSIDTYIAKAEDALMNAKRDDKNSISSIFIN